jgi:hypothetical protein
LRLREREPVDRDERLLAPVLRLAAAFGLELLLAERPADLEAVDFDRELDDFAFDPELERLLPERDPALLDLPELPLLLLLDEPAPSIDHLPLITRLAASATASAISEPSLVALESTDFAALSAVSAASIPASRIAFLAFGLALIAAAAAARPAASISLLIAALASFSVVVFDEPDDFELVLDDFDRAAEDFDFTPDERAPVLLLGLAIANLPFFGRIDT